MADSAGFWHTSAQESKNRAPGHDNERSMEQNIHNGRLWTYF